MYGDDSPHLPQEVRPGEQARLVKTVKIQVKVGGSSAWTRPSAPECGGTLKALAGDQRPIQGGDRPRRRLRGRYRLGSPAGRTPPHGDGSMYSEVNVRAGKCAAAPYPSVCRP